MPTRPGPARKPDWISRCRRLVRRHRGGRRSPRRSGDRACAARRGLREAPAFTKLGAADGWFSLPPPNDDGPDPISVISGPSRGPGVGHRITGVIQDITAEGMYETRVLEVTRPHQRSLPSAIAHGDVSGCPTLTLPGSDDEHCRRVRQSCAAAVVQVRPALRSWVRSRWGAERPWSSRCRGRRSARSPQGPGRAAARGRRSRMAWPCPVRSGCTAAGCKP